MKKILKILIISFAALLVLDLAVGGYFYWRGKAAEKTQTENRQGLKTFESRLDKFKVDYPEILYLQTTGIEPTLPSAIRLTDFKDLNNKPENNSIFDINVYDNDNTKNLESIKDYSFVKELQETNYTLENTTLDEKSAIKLTNSENIGQGAISVVYCLDDKKVYRLAFTPSTQKAYDDSNDIFEKIISGFQFAEQETVATGLIEKAYAAQTCSVLDQYYAPSSYNHDEFIPSPANNLGQTFTPTKNTVCRIDVRLVNVVPGTDATVWLNKGGTNLSSKNITAANGWNTATLPSSVSVTPGAEYTIYLSVGAGAAHWTGTLPGGYSRGHAIIGGFAENDLDFHFKEYAMSESENGDQNGDSDDQNGSQADNTTSKKGVSETEEVAEPTDTTAPKEPFNLRVWQLKLTGITEAYVDLEWDQVENEDLGGYLLYYGKKAGDYYYVIDNGTANTIRVSKLLPTDYYFAVKAYDKSGNLSNPSNEVKAELMAKIKQNYWWIFAAIAGLLSAATVTLIIIKKKGKGQMAQTPPE